MIRLFKSIRGHYDKIAAQLSIPAGCDYITVVIPELETKKWWHRLLHNQIGWILHITLVLRENVVVTTVPYHLKD